MDKLSSYILFSKEVPASADRLAFLGKRASVRYVEDGVKLSSAIKDLIQDEPLNRDQIHRVCEVANRETFKSLFEKQADKNVNFPLADFDEIVGVKVPSHVRPMPSAERKTYSPISRGEDIIVEIFGANTKTASSREPYPHEDPNAELNRTRERLKGLQEHALSKMSSLSVAEEQVATELKDKAEQAVLMGDGSFHDVLQALSPFVEDTGFFSKVATMLSAHLLCKGIIDRAGIAEGFDKTAGRRCPDPTHPIVSSFCALQEIQHYRRVMEETVKIAGENLQKVEKALGVRS